MKIIILQLARLGDILQSLPAIQGLKKKYPNSEITLVVRKKFSDSARLCSSIDKVIEFSTADILKPYFDNTISEPKDRALGNLSKWATENFSEKHYDMLINLTFSDASSWMASIISAKEKRGLVRAKDKGYMLADWWSQYFYSTVLQSRLNILHLNDLFCRISGVKEGYWPVEISKHLYPAVPAVRTRQKRVGIQIMTSVQEKTPSISSWVSICKKIVENGDAELVFFGAGADVDVIRTVIEKSNISDRSFVVAGTCQFVENIAWITSCDAIVSPDTAIVHLASIMQTPVVYIPMGNVRAEETGPYGADHTILYPFKADAESMAARIVEALAGKPIANTTPQSITKFTKCSNGSLRNECVPVNYIQDEATGFFEKSYYLLSEFRGSGQIEDIPVPVLGQTQNGNGLDKILKGHDLLDSVAKAAKFGSNYCMQMLNALASPDDLKDLSLRLNEVDKLLEQIEVMNPQVKPIITMWKVAKGNVMSSQLDELIALTEGTYRELNQNVDIILQLMQTAVNAAHDKLKPKAKHKEKEPQI